MKNARGTHPFSEMLNCHAHPQPNETSRLSEASDDFTAQNRPSAVRRTDLRTGSGNVGDGRKRA
ncbi:hypothetical protein PAMC26510_23400 [Caballeronia sordidicola]|uniref:Uncharacterized protein n=1 Tax=Caballeronia sordidicola TaxID=196367 RepID=A0A242MJ73_CABSO|nr:hypothetical protein PAMC26510_23400 [Caballeronia sordidicola]